MATTLEQQNTRANDSAFQAVVAAAFWQIIPDVIGEAVGESVNDGASAVVLTQGMIDKRHAWATDFTRQPAYWVPKCAAMLAGEEQILNVDLPDLPDDSKIKQRASRLVHALAGVKAGD